MIEMVNMVESVTFNGARSLLNANEVKVDDLVKMASYPSADHATASYVLTALLRPENLNALADRVIIKTYTIHRQEHRRSSLDSFNVKERLDVSFGADGIEFWLTFTDDQGREVAKGVAFFSTGNTKSASRYARLMFRFYCDLAREAVNGLQGGSFDVGRFSFGIGQALDQVDVKRAGFEREADDLEKEGLGDHHLVVKSEIVRWYGRFMREAYNASTAFLYTEKGSSFTDYDRHHIVEMQRHFNYIKRELSMLFAIDASQNGSKPNRVFSNNVVERAFRKAIQPVVIHWLENDSGPARRLKGL